MSTRHKPPSPVTDGNPSRLAEFVAAAAGGGAIFAWATAAVLTRIDSMGVVDIPNAIINLTIGLGIVAVAMAVALGTSNDSRKHRVQLQQHTDTQLANLRADVAALRATVAELAKAINRRAAQAEQITQREREGHPASRTGRRRVPRQAQPAEPHDAAELDTRFKDYLAGVFDRDFGEN